MLAHASRQAFTAAVLVAATAAVGHIVANAAAAGEPAAPSNCTAVVQGFWGVSWANVTWTDNSLNEDGFTVEWQSNAGTVIENVGPDITSVYMGLNPGSNQYRVRAFNAIGTSAWCRAPVLKVARGGSPGGGGNQ